MTSGLAREDSDDASVCGTILFLPLRGLSSFSLSLPKRSGRRRDAIDTVAQCDGISIWCRRTLIGHTKCRALLSSPLYFVWYILPLDDAIRQDTIRYRGRYGIGRAGGFRSI
ncbi:unnamed protein product [Ascophyllum nodosum]